MPAPDVVWRRMRRLAAQATVDVHTQHLVSRALLGQFAAPIGQHRAAQVYALNLEYPHAKLKGRGLKTCGSAPVEDFVKFESGTLEKVWARVETGAHAEYSAVRDGSALLPEHLDWLRDLIAIHHARSIQYYTVFEDSRQSARQVARRFWQHYPEVLDAIAASRLGLPGGDGASRDRAAQELQRRISKQIEDGVLFHVMMGYRYWRTRHWLRSLGVEILTPSRGEFVIGDIPALAVRKGMPAAGVNSASAMPSPMPSSCPSPRISCSASLTGQAATPRPTATRSPSSMPGKRAAPSATSTFAPEAAWKTTSGPWTGPDPPRGYTATSTRCAKQWPDVSTPTGTHRPATLRDA